MRYLENDEVTEQMVTGGWWHPRWRWSWPRSSSRFLVPVFPQGPGLPRVAPRRRPTKKILSAPESHHRVQGQLSSVSAKIRPETGNAFRNQFFFCNPWKHLQPRLTLRVYAHFIARMSINLLFTHTMHFLCVNTVNGNSLTVMGARDGKERPPKLRPPAKKAMASMTISPIRRSESA